MKAQGDMERMKLKAALDVRSEAQKQQIQTTANLAEERGKLALKEQAASAADSRKAALGGGQSTT